MPNHILHASLPPCHWPCPTHFQMVSLLTPTASNMKCHLRKGWPPPTLMRITCLITTLLGALLCLPFFFPIKFSDDWKDRTAMDAPFVLNHVVFTDRSTPLISSTFHTWSASPQLLAHASASCVTVAWQLAMVDNRLWSTRRLVSSQRPLHLCPAWWDSQFPPHATHPLHPFLCHAAKALRSSAPLLCWAAMSLPHTHLWIRTACSSPCQSYALTTTPCMCDLSSMNPVMCPPWTTTIIRRTTNCWQSWMKVRRSHPVPLRWCHTPDPAYPLQCLCSWLVPLLPPPGCMAPLPFRSPRSRFSIFASPSLSNISTQWYCTPEVLLKSRDYSNSVYMWAWAQSLPKSSTSDLCFQERGSRPTLPDNSGSWWHLWDLWLWWTWQVAQWQEMGWRHANG